MTIRFVISLLFAILVAIFAMQNSMSVTINFLFVEFTISQALVILISAVFGAIIVLFLGTITQIKANMKIRNLTKKINVLEEEKKALSNKIDEENKVLTDKPENLEIVNDIVNNKAEIKEKEAE